MRNGGYRGVYDPTTQSKTYGSHTATDQFELVKRFGGVWFIETAPISLDDTAPNHNGTVNAAGDIDEGVLFDFNTSSGTATRVFSTKLKSGKFYFEINYTFKETNTLMVCPIAHDSATNGTSATHTITGINMWYANNGNFYPGASSSGLGGFNTVPEILRCAYDMGTGKCWFGANDLWSSQTGDPENGGAGVDIYGYSTYGDDGNYRVLFGNGNSGNYTNRGQFLTGTSVVNSVPSGFAAH